MQHKLKVLYDHQIFTWQKYGGISRYYCELMNQFYFNRSIDFELSFNLTINEYLPRQTYAHVEYRKHDNESLFDGRSYIEKALVRILADYRAPQLYRCLNLYDHELFNRLLFKYSNPKQIADVEAINKEASIRSLRKNDFDIFHPTYYDPYFLNRIHNRPFALTIYDMIHEVFCKRFPHYNNEVILRKKILAFNASMIIAISENTKNDIIRLYGIDGKKIKVVHLANSLRPHETKKRRVNIKLPDRYILFVGDRYVYKNFPFFIKSVSELLHKDKKLFVACGGGQNFAAEEMDLFESLDCRQQIIYFHINDALLIELYSRALAFVFPSLYEGFGIPILEAFSCGCPVILSNASSFPEVAEDAGVYFDPLNETELRNSLKEVIYNNLLRRELKKKGFMQLKKFSWDRTAIETAHVYKQI